VAAMGGVEGAAEEAGRDHAAVDSMSGALAKRFRL
jgi:hypothetical protein